MHHPENIHEDQPLFPLPGSSTNPDLRISAVDGRPLTEVTNPEELVAVSFGSGKRELLLSAGGVLAHDGTPIVEVEDGAVQHRDPNRTTIKFGGKVIAISDRPEDPRLEK